MNKHEKSKISIVIPCYNEEGNAPVIRKAVSEALANEDIEIIFIDDCSSDGTLEKLRELAFSDARVKYISFSRNFGQQSGLRAGFEYATGDCVISLDADMQHPPELLPQMIEKWREGSDIVYTRRKDIENIPFLKRISSALFYRIINLLSDVKIDPGSADFRLLDRRIVDILVNDINEYHLYYKGMISWIGFRQASIEYIPEKRHSGTTKWNFFSLLNLAIDGITAFSIKPLKLAILLGLMLSVFSGLYGLYALYMYFFTDATVPGWTSVLLSILFLGGVNMILLGIIGEYVGRIYIQSKRRPHFLVKESNVIAKRIFSE
jgi:dolichol-phosphate mannosyltransferase